MRDVTTDNKNRPLTPAQVADLFSVTITTVGLWADSGKLPHFRTPGGQRRFKRQDVELLLGHPIDDAVAS